MFKLIFYILIFYFAFKVYKYFKRVFFTPASKTTSGMRGTKGRSIQINKEDIIEAEFEDIEDTKQKENKE